MIYKNFDRHSFLGSLVATGTIFSLLLFTTQAYAASVTLSVTVQTSISFTVSTDNFLNVTPGTPVYATSTLAVTTNDSLGWNVTLSGDKKKTSNINLQRTGDTTLQIADQTEWINGAATTTAGNAVRISSFGTSGNVLAFRVMTASSSNGIPFLAPTWWGTTDGVVDSATNLWGGIASSTVSRQIGNAGTGSYSSSAHLNTVNYYLSVATAQKTGAYTAPITYTATGN